MVGLINTLIVLLIVACILGLLWYAFQQIPLPPIARTVAIVVLCIIAAIFLLSFLTGSMSLPQLIRG